MLALSGRATRSWYRWRKGNSKARISFRLAISVVSGATAMRSSRRGQRTVMLQYAAPALPKASAMVFRWHGIDLSNELANSC